MNVEFLTSPLGFAGLLLSVALFAACCALAPRAALLLSLFAGYNPVFSYYFLLSQAFRGGEVRAVLSTACVVLLGVIILLKRDVSPLTQPTAQIGWYSALWLVFPLIGFALGLLKEHELRECVAELLPLVEFLAYFWVAARLIRNFAQAENVTYWIVLWTGIVGIFELLEFVALGSRISLRIDLSGRIAGRLTDFMPACSLPIAVALALCPRSRYRRRVAILFAGTSAGVVAMASYYRSLWVACVMGLMLLGLLIARKAVSARTLGRLIGGAAFVFAVGLYLLMLVSGSPQGQIFADLAARLDVGQLVGAEQSSSLGRLSFVRDILYQSLASPFWGQGLGAPFYSSWAGRALLITDAPNFFLKLLYQLGAVGFCSYLFVLYVVVRRSFQRFHAASGNGSFLCAGIISGLFGFVVMATVFPAFLHFPIAPVSAVLLACLFRTPTLPRLRLQRTVPSRAAVAPGSGAPRASGACS